MLTQRAFDRGRRIPVSGESLYTMSSTLAPLHRGTGVAAIFVGAVLIRFNRDMWDVVVLNLPRGHGIHIRDVAGMALLTFGTIVLWRSPRSSL
jgi:hypothetical protein